MSPNVSATLAWLRVSGFMCKGCERCTATPHVTHNVATQTIARSLPVMMKTFAAWSDVLTAARNGAWLWYHAPMDLRAQSVRIVRVYKNGKIRIDPGCGADLFTADEGHLSRFRTRAV